MIFKILIAASLCALAFAFRQCKKEPTPAEENEKEFIIRAWDKNNELLFFCSKSFPSKKDAESYLNSEAAKIAIDNNVQLGRLEVNPKKII